jgi:uncharacterized protein YndB with AHSA1/START domain
LVEKYTQLPCGADRAFSLFTAGIDRWWPPERRHLPGGDSVIVLAPDGFSESAPGRPAVALGAVRAWEPPERLVLDWYPGTDADHPTHVEIRFVPAADGRSTRVEVRHRAGPASSDLFPTRAPRYAASWDLVLAALLAAVANR